MASKTDLYMEIVNTETQRLRDEISARAAQLADRRSQMVESAPTPREGAAVATAVLSEMVQELSEILQKGIEAKVYPTFEWLRQRVGPFASPGVDMAQPRREDLVFRVRPKTLIEKALGSRRYEDDIAKAEATFQARLEEHRSSQEQLAQQKRQHDSKFALISEWEKEYQRGDGAAVSAYCGLIIGCCEFPCTFPVSHRANYSTESKELLIDYALPAVGVVPAWSEFKWIQSRKCVDRKLRKAAETKEIYQDLIAAVALRCTFEVFRAEHLGHVVAVVFNGFVNAVDPATGHDAKPYLISVQVTREHLSRIDLRRVEKVACLRSLGARISPRPADLIPIEQLVDFDRLPSNFTATR